MATLSDSRSHYVEPRGVDHPGCLLNSSTQWDPGSWFQQFLQSDHNCPNDALFSA